MQIIKTTPTVEEILEQEEIENARKFIEEELRQKEEDLRQKNEMRVIVVVKQSQEIQKNR